LNIYPGYANEYVRFSRKDGRCAGDLDCGERIRNVYVIVYRLQLRLRNTLKRLGSLRVNGLGWLSTSHHEVTIKGSRATWVRLEIAGGINRYVCRVISRSTFADHTYEYGKEDAQEY
jgi:hypothetical protein